MSSSRLVRFSPGRMILLALFFVIILGTCLLALPAARRLPISVIDLLFTATSVTCVTGIFTVPLENFTFFGQCILLFLMQIGGLGIITLTLFLFSSFVNLGLATQLMAGRLLELESWKNIRQLLVFIVITTVSFELLGAFCFFWQFSKNFMTNRAIFLSLFHAVSFFCNAGITLFGNSLQMYAHNYMVIITATLLMLAGGLGFITLYELFDHIINLKRKRNHHFSLQSKIVLTGSLLGIIITALLVYLLEYNHAFSSFGPFGSMITSIFQAVSFRSTGLLTIPVTSLQMATLLLIMIVSFIGSAPGSTGSGIRTTTLAVYMGVVKAAVEGHTAINLLYRRIARDQVNKAIAIISLSIFWIALSVFCLLVLEPQFKFIEVLFEVMGAFTNLGLSLGITSSLSLFGKMLIIFTMIIGRIGSLTLILALRKIAIRKETMPTEKSYPEERIMLS